MPTPFKRGCGPGHKKSPRPLRDPQKLSALPGGMAGRIDAAWAAKRKTRQKAATEEPHD